MEMMKVIKKIGVPLCLSMTFLITIPTAGPYISHVCVQQGVKKNNGVSGTVCECKKNFTRNGVSVVWDVSDAHKKELGSITKQLNSSCTLPSHLEKNIVTFVPSAGRFARERIDILMVGFSLKKPFPAAIPAHLLQELTHIKDEHNWVESVVKLYRRITPEQEWTEVGLFCCQLADVQRLPATQMIVFTDGKAKIATEYKNERTGQIEKDAIIIDFAALF